MTVIERVSLTGRQRQILEYVGMGKTNGEIAQILGISPYTVKNVVQVLCEKYGVSDRTACYRMGLINGDIEVPKDPRQEPKPPTKLWAIEARPSVPEVTHRLGTEVELSSDETVRVNGVLLEMHLTERKYLKFFIEHDLQFASRVHSRDFIISGVYGVDRDINISCVDVHVARINKHLAETPWSIRCVHGVGYKLIRK